MEGGRGFDRRAPVPLREGGGREGEDVGPAVARGPLDGPERGGTGVLRGGDGGDPRDLAWDGRIHRREDDRARRVRGRARGPGAREPDRHEHRERRRRPPGAPDASRRTVMDDPTGCAPVVPPPDGPAAPRLRHRQHRDQRRDRTARRERQGTGGSIPSGRERRTRNRTDHSGRIGRAPAERPRRGRAPDGPEPRAPHATRRGSSDARSARGLRAEDELRREAHRGRRGREHRRAFGPPRGDHGSDSRRRRESVRRQVGSDRSGEPFRRRVQDPQIPATNAEPAAEPRSLLVAHATELLSLRGPAGPRRHEAAGELGIVEDGALYAEGERIVDVGSTADVLGRHPRASVTIDATGQTVLPGFLDGATAAGVAATREHEVDWKAQGLGYREIAARGGGILHTVRATREAREEDLVRTAAERLRSMLAFGTTTIEVKSGYGLRTEDELKILRAAAKGGQAAGVAVVRTLLGAHAIPPEFEARADAYVELVAGDMIDAVASSGLASSCRVFVDDGFFTVDQARHILTRAKSAGLGAKVHADELANTGGAVLAAEIGAASADHLLHASSDGIDALARTAVVGVLLPATSLVSHLPFADGRRLITAGVPVALGTDFNPNTWCESPQLTIALGCHHNGLLPAQAIVAATINAAHAVGVGAEVGSLEPGKLADILVLGVPSYRHLGYRIGGNAVRVVIKRGAVQIGGPIR